jgi:hypothetical protein
MIKAMTDVVLPAVDTQNKLAQEQAKLIVGMLNIMAQRLPLSFRYDRDELSRYLALADTVRDLAKGGEETSHAANALHASIDAGEDVLNRARAEPSELEAALVDLRGKIGALTKVIAIDGDPNCRKNFDRAILAASHEQVQRERAWLITQGWEANPTAIPPIETLLNGGQLRR